MSGYRFDVTSQQGKKAKAWWLSHRIEGEDHYNKGMEWVFSNNSGIGCAVYARCRECGDVVDLTDYASW